ncbi:MAG: divalent-cation tolerance protein CutA [bacterium]|nr:divalent-cation tolerance protein CutA [bacterium]
MLVILTTTSNTDEAESLANGLVEHRLAACVQILPKMTSVYAWEGKVEKESEHLLLIKTLPEKYEAVEKYILDRHTYDTPEIVAIPAEKVSAGYLKWLTSYL